MSIENIKCETLKSKPRDFFMNLQPYTVGVRHLEF